jgi:hypothetical protein
MMCNMIKSARPYGFFVAHSRKFPEEHRETNRADADDGRSIKAMSRKFTKRLRAQHCDAAA